MPSHFLQIWQISCLCNMSPAGGQHVSIHTSPLAPAPPYPAEAQGSHVKPQPHHGGPGEESAPWHHTAPAAPTRAQGLCCFQGFSLRVGVASGCTKGLGSGLASSSG